MAKTKVKQASSEEQPVDTLSDSYVERTTIKEPLEAYLKKKVAAHKEKLLNKRKYDTTAELKGSLLIFAVSEKPENHLTTFEKMELVRTGISKKGLEQLKSKTTLDYDKFAKMLSTTKATLINKKGEEKFNTTLSERILSVADVYSYGYEVFEDADRFNSWMLSPIRALSGKAPYEIMDNQFGREEVRNIIGRIAYGVFS